MIKEIFKYFTTPACPMARKMGYVYQSITGEENFRRHQNECLPHIEKCLTFITENINLAEKKETVLVLGSGHLREIPIEILCQKFKHVILVDLVHPQAVRDLAKSNHQILLLEVDLSGTCQKILNLKKQHQLPEPEMPDLHFTSPDLIISANNLSQLPLLPRKYIKKKYGQRFNDIELNFFCQSIIEKHLNMLNSFNKPVLVLTDSQTLAHHKATDFMSLALKEKAYILKVS